MVPNRMRVYKKILCCFLLTFFAVSAGCETPAHEIVQQETFYWRKLSLIYVQDADPSADAKLAIQNRDLFLVGLVEVGRLVPELEYHDDLEKKMPTHLIEGTSDTNPPYEEDRATQYARIFNLTVIRFATRQH